MAEQVDLSPHSSRPSLAELRALLVPVVNGARAILLTRVAGAEPPAWCQPEWVSFLAALPEGTLRKCEAEGLEQVLPELPQAPTDLRELAQLTREATAWLSPPPQPERVRELRGARQRKRQQVAALAQLCRERLGPCLRVVDVGSGHGHLTRELAQELGVPALGLDRDPERIARALSLTEVTNAGFAAFDASAEPLRFLPGDLAVGLHACGSLGDMLIQAAAHDQVSLVLVSCCLQKIEPRCVRDPLSSWGQQQGLEFDRDVLGLSNLTSRRTLVEGSLDQASSGRALRYALRSLLGERGLSLAPGEEMRGLHRRWVSRGLAFLAQEALRRRNLPAPTSDELLRAENTAAQEYPLVRRLSLPRNMLGRVLEAAVVVDRATRLEEAGHEVTVRAVFPPDVSPRNLGIIGRAG